jgi:hypothetical protein
MNDRTMRIVTLLARHGTAKYPNALVELKAMFAGKRLAAVDHECVIVDNSLPLGHAEHLEPRVTLIGGSNEAWEFSAWDTAVAFLGRRILDCDFVHLTTAAFRQLYVRYLDLFDDNMLRVMRGRAAAVGHVDCYNAPVALLGTTCQSWLRTSFVFLPPTEVELLGKFASMTNGERFFSGNPRNPFRSDAPLSEGYRQNILNWLTGDGTGQGTEWHSRFQLSDETLPFFQSKALAIVNEQMLSNRLRAQGCAIVDATWLAAQVTARGLGHASLGCIPAWWVQVTSRDIDAVPRDLLL